MHPLPSILRASDPCNAASIYIYVSLQILSQGEKPLYKFPLPHYTGMQMGTDRQVLTNLVVYPELVLMVLYDLHLN